MSDRYRGRTTRQRNVAEKVARDWAARRAASELTEKELDLEKASVDAEVELLDPAARRAQEGADAPPSRPRRPAATRSADRTGSSSRGAGRRVPDLAVLPRLLHATGAFGSLRDRLGDAGTAPGMHGKHVGLTSVPHGAKSYLAAALALAPEPERICWIARDAEIGDRVAEELGAWLGDPALVAILEPRTSLAYERSELVPDETAARVAALAAWRSGRAKVLVASIQALVQATLAPDDLPAEIRTLRAGQRIALDALLAELLERGYSPVIEVAGRGEFARRGGIVDIFPPSAPLPVRIELFGDEIDSMRAFDPTDQRSVEPVREVVLLPATEFLLPAGGAEEIRTRLGRTASRLPERLAQDLARFGGGCGDRREGRRGSRARTPGTPPRSGPGSSPRAPASTTSMRRPSSSSTSPATSPTRPTSCGARPTSGTRRWSRRATCPGTGPRPISRRVTGRAACTARGPSS